MYFNLYDNLFYWHDFFVGEWVHSVLLILQRKWYYNVCFVYTINVYDNFHYVWSSLKSDIKTNEFTSSGLMIIKYFWVQILYSNFTFIQSEQCIYLIQCSVWLIVEYKYTLVLKSFMTWRFGLGCTTYAYI